MRYKKIIFIFMLILSLLLISSVSAQDNQTDADLEISENSIELAQINENTIVSETHEDEILKSNTTTGSKEIYFESYINSEYIVHNYNETVYFKTHPSIIKNISVYLDDDKIDNIEFDGEDYYTEIPTADLPYGLHNISFIFPGNAKYAPANKTYSFNITHLKAYIPQNNWGDESSFLIYASGDDNANITIYVDDKINKRYTVKELNDYYENEDSIYLYNIDDGIHKINIVYEDGNITVNKSGTYEVTYISFECYTTEYGNMGIQIYGDDDVRGDIILNINSKEISVKMKNGDASATIPKEYLKLGNNTVTLNYMGSKKYPKYNTTKTFSVIPKYTTPYYASTDETEKVLFEIPADTNGTITLYRITESEAYDYTYKKISQSDVKTGFITIPKAKAGEYNYGLELKDSDNNTFTEKFYMIVKKNTAGFKASVTPKTVKYMNEVTVKLKSPVNGYASVYVDGQEVKSFKIKKDKTASTKVTIKKSGKHTVKVVYHNYSKKFYSKAFSVTVKKPTSYIKLDKVNVKKSAKKLTLKATVTKVNGKALKGKKVTFKFNGKTYNAKTNSKGIAKITIKKSELNKLKTNKKITYSATYSYTVSKTVKVSK